MAHAAAIHWCKRAVPALCALGEAIACTIRGLMLVRTTHDMAGVGMDAKRSKHQRLASPAPLIVHEASALLRHIAGEVTAHSRPRPCPCAILLEESIKARRGACLESNFVRLAIVYRLELDGQPRYGRLGCGWWLSRSRGGR